MEMSGTIVSRYTNIGSKSERLTYFIKTDDGSEYILRKRGENPFVNPSLRGLAGKTVRVKGTIEAGLFLAEELKELAEGQSSKL